MSTTVELSTSLIGLMVSAGAFIFSFFRASKGDVKELEHRLTELESSRKSEGFNENDRKCMQELKVKMDIVWGVFENDLPRLLKQCDTPELDELLDVISTKGIRGLTDKEYKKLEGLIDAEYSKLVQNEINAGRALGLAIFKAVMKYVKYTGSDYNGACTHICER